MIISIIVSRRLCQGNAFIAAQGSLSEYMPNVNKPSPYGKEIRVCRLNSELRPHPFGSWLRGGLGLSPFKPLPQLTFHYDMDTY